MVKPVCKECYNRRHMRFRARSSTNANLYHTDDEKQDDDEEYRDKKDNQQPILVAQNNEQ